MAANLKDRIIQNSGIKPVVYDADYNVSFELSYLRKVEFQEIINRNTSYKFNVKTQNREEVTDHLKLQQEIYSKHIHGWKGVTWEWLSTRMMLDLEGIDIKENIPFNAENFQLLIDNVTGIESWLMEACRDARNFYEKKEVEAKN